MYCSLWPPGNRPGSLSSSVGPLLLPTECLHPVVSLSPHLQILGLRFFFLLIRDSISTWMETALICRLLLQYGVILSVYEQGRIFHLLLLSSIDFVVVLQFSLQWSLSSLSPTALFCSFLFSESIVSDNTSLTEFTTINRGNFLCVSLYPAGMFNFCYFYGSCGRVFSLLRIGNERIAHSSLLFCAWGNCPQLIQSLLSQWQKDTIMWTPVIYPKKRTEVEATLQPFLPLLFKVIQTLKQGEQKWNLEKS